MDRIGRIRLAVRSGASGEHDVGGQVDQSRIDLLGRLGDDPRSLDDHRVVVTTVGEVQHGCGQDLPQHATHPRRVGDVHLTGGWRHDVPSRGLGPRDHVGAQEAASTRDDQPRPAGHLRCHREGFAGGVSVPSSAAIEARIIDSAAPIELRNARAGRPAA